MTKTLFASLFVVLTALGMSAGSRHTNSAESHTRQAKVAQCSCCSKDENAYPAVHCSFLCDKGGRFDRVFFEARSSTITPAAEKVLRKQALCLKRNDYGAVLYASADAHESPDERSAYRLSRDRAAAVRDFFVSMGIPASAIRLVPDGLLGQATQGRTLARRKFNRYVRTAAGAPIR